MDTFLTKPINDEILKDLALKLELTNSMSFDTM
jgi:hypothetical protein